MDAQVPRTTLKLAAGSLADDLSYTALADVVHALEEAGEVERYRLIGGQMVTLLAARWDLGRELERETKDADVGTHKIALNSGEIVKRLEAKAYRKTAGNRFERPVDDLPIGEPGEKGEPDHHAVVDLLIADTTSRIHDSVEVGDIVTTEVPGLAIALRRDPIPLELDITRLNGHSLKIPVVVPDEASSLILKTLAWDVRKKKKDTDAADIWRCLEIARAARVGPDDLDSDEGRAVRSLLTREFDQNRGDVMLRIEGHYRLSRTAATERQTRIRALIREVCGPR